MNRTSYHKIIGLLLAVAFTLPTGVFAQYDPNQAANQSAYDAAVNANGTISNGAAYDSYSAQGQGASDSSYVNFKAANQNNSLPSGSVYNQWITTQADNANTSVNTKAGITNGNINKDIFNPNQSYTDVNTGLFNAGKDASTAALNNKKNNCTVTIKKFGDIFIVAACVINRFLLAIAISFAMIYFIWGVVQYVLSADSAEERKKSKQVMLWGVLAMFVIVSVWGLVDFMRTVLGI